MFVIGYCSICPLKKKQVHKMLCIVIHAMLKILSALCSIISYTIWKKILCSYFRKKKMKIWLKSSQVEHGWRWLSGVEAEASFSLYNHFFCKLPDFPTGDTRRKICTLLGFFKTRNISSPGKFRMIHNRRIKQGCHNLNQVSIIRIIL